MPVDQQVAAAAQAASFLENEEGDAIAEALMTPSKREKYVKTHLDSLSSMVRVFFAICDIINTNIQIFREKSRSGIETVGIATLPEVPGSLVSVTHSFASSPVALEAWKRFMPHFKELEKILAGKNESVQSFFR